ncbi:MAG: flagellar biosynthetic protein FliO [Hahellaceae bacterium]|jgi:flagellar protein FliO/FliZ|nr:flagellar biosynthetic protein FliO [Hahellaceae bacterium]MCP5213266.1 flagellar biosynthetic protein FliO [Hahellaceae bacterium]
MMTVIKNNNNPSAQLPAQVSVLTWAILIVLLVITTHAAAATTSDSSESLPVSAPTASTDAAQVPGEPKEVTVTQETEVLSVPETAEKKSTVPVSSIFAEKDTPSSATSLLSMVLGLLFVITLIVVVAWGVRRFSTLHASGGKHIKVLSATMIGARERLALVEVGDKRILIGVTPQQINTLHVFAKEDIPDERETSDFARKLQEIMKKGKVQ